jgi:hypothetical protein
MSIADIADLAHTRLDREVGDAFRDRRAWKWSSLPRAHLNRARRPRRENGVRRTELVQIRATMIPANPNSIDCVRFERVDRERGVLHGLERLRPTPSSITRRLRSIAMDG